MRKLRIGTDTLRFVAGHKDRIDALSFAILIKQKRINSTITNATQRKLKNTLCMGADKLRKTIKDGVEFGFLRWEKKHLIANKLHNKAALTHTIKREWFINAKKKSGTGKLKFTSVRSMVEMLIITNHVNIQSSCRDTHNSATEGRTVTEIRSAKHRERRMLKKDYDAKFTGLSNIRIQQLIERKHNKACKIVKAAIAKKLIVKRIREKEFYVVGEPFGTLAKAMLRDTNIIVWTQKHSARIKFSNEYQYVGDNISKANHGK